MPQTDEQFDVAIIGAGVFGVWTAYHLQKAGKRVALLDAYGAGNNRASSGGESRVIRMSYGSDEIYTRWSLRSLALWQDFSQQIGQTLFHPIGVLWMARTEDPYTLSSVATLEKVGINFETLRRAELAKRFPQIYLGPITWGVYEPDSGALMARRAVQAVAEEVLKSGAAVLLESVLPPSGKGKVKQITTQSGLRLNAESFVFACGTWLPKLFPKLLKGRIHPTKQDVFFFGTASGDKQYSPPAMPVWADFGEEIYGIPNLENRGFKVAIDRHGAYFDPDAGQRAVTPERLAEARRYIAKRFPGLKKAPLLEARVCQYENTSNGDFLIDRHPEFDNVWLVGGGSGHGFKHGPALGEYLAEQVTSRTTASEPRFLLATKKRVQKRTVF